MAQVIPVGEKGADLESAKSTLRIVGGTAVVCSVLGSLVSAFSIGLFGVHPWSATLRDGWAYLPGLVLGPVVGLLMLLREARVLGPPRWLLIGCLALGGAVTSHFAQQVWIELSSKHSGSPQILVLESLEELFALGFLRWVTHYVPLAIGLVLGVWAQDWARPLRVRMALAGVLTLVFGAVTVTCSDLDIAVRSRDSWWQPWWASLRCHWPAELALRGTLFALMIPLVHGLLVPLTGLRGYSDPFAASPDEAD